jgi:hypothetical protein
MEFSEEIGAMRARLDALLSLSATLSTEHRAVLEEAEELIAALNGVTYAMHAAAAAER